MNLEQRVAALEQRNIQLGDLPFQKIKNKLDLEWMPDNESAGTPPVAAVAMLPAATLGQTIIFEAATDVYWQLFCDDPVATYPWKFIGGAPLFGTTLGPPVSYAHAAGTYSDYLVGPVPLGGDYNITASVQLQSTAGNDTVVSLVKTTARNLSWPVARSANAAEGYERGALTGQLNMSIGGNLGLSVYHVALGGGSTVLNGTLSTIPIRVG